MNKKKYLYEIDLIRGLAVIIILLKHGLIFYHINLGFFKKGYFNNLSAFGVPLFYFISGFSLTIKYKNNLNINLKEFYKKRYQYLLPCYLFWSYMIIFMRIIGIPFYYNHNIIYEKSFFLNFMIYYLIHVLTGQVFTLWFIFMIFQFYLIYPYLLKVYKKTFYITQLILIIINLIAFLIIYSYVYKSLQVADILIITFLFGFIFFQIGVFTSYYWKKIKFIIKNNFKIKILISVIYFISVFLFLFNPEIFLIRLFYCFTSIFFYLMLFNQLNIKNKISRFFLFNSQYSLGLYLTHRFSQFIITLFIKFLIDLFKINLISKNIFLNFSFILFKFLFMYFLSLILIRLFWKIPYGYYLIGKK